MKNVLVLLIISAGITFAQKCYVESVTGTVKAQIGSSEKWMEVSEGAELPPYSTISTGEKSSVVLVKGNTKKSSAITLMLVSYLPFSERGPSIISASSVIP